MMAIATITGIGTEMAILLLGASRALAETPPRQVLCEAASTLAMILALLPLAAAISGSGDQLLQPLAIALIAGTPYCCSSFSSAAIRLTIRE